MAIEKIGINFSRMDNLTAPDFNLSTTTEGLFNDIPKKANEITNGAYGLTILVTLWLFLYWKFTEKATNFADFKYGKIRGAGVASGMCGIIGLFLLSIGYFTNFYHVVIFIVITLVSTLWVWKEERS